MILKTKRLLLREVTEDDVQAIYAYQADPRYLRFYPATTRTLEDSQEFVARLIAWQQERPRSKFQLGIVLAAEGRLIGNCGIRKPAPSAPEAELGYELDPDYWGHGYATEAAQAMLDMAFTHLRLARVYASCVAENVGSAHVLEKLGMRLEKRLRRQQWMKGRWWDELCYGILAAEWQQRQQAATSPEAADSSAAPDEEGEQP
jgi:ribosomal-protein-alanine N-acetyltransferase